MKFKHALLTMISAAFIVVSCGGPQGERATTSDEQAVIESKGTVYTAETSSSKIEWVGTKPTGQHNGTINVTKGEIFVENGEITGGEMVIDMKSIQVLDLTDAETNAKLRNHLLSPDFFETETYPEARFVFTSVKPYTGEQTGAVNFTHTVSGNLTMKDATRNVTFPAMIDIQENAMKAVTDNFIIDRSEWNVKFGSRKFFDNLADNFIHDDISLRIMFLANKE
ncbi:MAG: YceI family protein [Bacteroidales bacterium]|nr:YceI family protein [Bacteroidales bacterium]